MKSNFDLSCGSSKSRHFVRSTSFENPESYKWWRKVSAIKTKPNSTVSVKKTIQSSTMKYRDNNIIIHKNSSGSFKRKAFLFSDENFKKTPLNRKEDGGERVRVLRTLSMFRAKCKEISRSRVSVSVKDIRRIDFKAKEELIKQGEIQISSSKVIGPVPGVEVGDRFEYRVELTIVGLHGRIQHGIDYMEYKGKSLVTCVVAKEGYFDKMDDSQVITYTGEGGIARNKEGVFPKDQKLVSGNLAMKNSMIAKNDVRVVRGLRVGAKFKDGRYDPIAYIYDGLYKVVSYEKKIGPYKNFIFEFKLKRCPGQPSVPWYKFKAA
ncbi:histone-lysine N-methyltransferase, H3 lysine-9 specific SUVH5-like [Chenopodium quinoa]|uniref:YDG domain-containing protein n=1 Tax=Chenopodium quinoa TaxID=63459 RepID=A0A803LUI2_CHEQI|nr:histone-lysine N-methyltransferase, H3 lysine-9 specific SUVH5-like [Chenopodium quinoa]